MSNVSKIEGKQDAQIAGKQKIPNTTFISFKTDPDLQEAEWVYRELEKRNIPLIPLYGGETCPYGDDQLQQARAWVRNYLKQKISTARVLVVICSEASLRSQWVFLEYAEALRQSDLVFLLNYTDGDPVQYFLPAPRWFSRRLPACPIYQCDMREEAERKIDVIAEQIRSIGQIRRKVRLLKWVVSAFVILPFFALIVAALFMLMFYAYQESGTTAIPDTQKIGKSIMGAGLGFTALFAAFFFPIEYRLSRKFTRLPWVTLIVRGFHNYRLYFIVFGIVLLVFGVVLSGVIGNLILIFIASMISNGVYLIRERLTNNALKHFDEMNMPVIGPSTDPRV